MSNQTQNILRTKLHRPQVTANLVSRPWLLEWLTQHRQRPLTLVCAPAGYGKTTLISSWLDAINVPSAWVSLDEYDDDLTEFLTYIIAAVQTIFPKIGQETLALLNAATLPPLSTLAHTLISDLEQITSPFILALDDYHVIHDTDVHNLLNELLRRPPSTIHIVIITRRDPPLPVTQLRARAQVTEIRSQELRFTTAETAVFLQQMGLQVAKATAAELTRKTEGWVTGLRLSVLSLRHRDADGLLTGTPENVYYVTDYLTAETLSQLTPAIQGFLLKTSILERLNGPLCDSLLGLDEPECHGQACLDWLHQQNLFIIPLDDQRYWYRYHHLFQQLLQRQLEERLNAQSIAALHIQAADWYAKNGFIDEALQHTLNAGDISAAAQLIEQHSPALLNGDKWHTLKKWMAKLPDNVIRQRPKLLLTKAWVAFHQFALQAIPSILETVEPLLNNDAALQPLWGEVDFFHGYHWFWQGQSVRSLTLFRRALERIPETYHVARSEAELFWSLAAQMDGKEKEAVHTLNKWLYYEQTPHPARQLKLLGALTFVHLLSGELIKVNQVVQQAQDVATKNDNIYIKIWASYLKAYIHYYQNDLKGAVHHFMLAVEKRYIMHTRAAIDSLAGLALTYQAMQQSDKANATMKRLLEFAGETHNPANIAIANSCYARLLLWQGKLELAARHLQIDNLTTNFGIMFYWLECPRLTQCRILIAQETPAALRQAAEKLKGYAQANQKEHNTHRLIEILLLQTLLYHKQGQSDKALTVLKQAVTLARPGYFIRPFVETGSEITYLLNQLQEQGIAPNYIEQILNAFSDYPPEINSPTEPLQTDFQSEGEPHASPLLDSLTNRELDVLQLLAQRFSNKEIAAQLFISPLTVKKHTVNLYRKLGVGNRRQAVSKAVALGFISRY